MSRRRPGTRRELLKQRSRQSFLPIRDQKTARVFFMFASVAVRTLIFWDRLFTCVAISLAKSRIRFQQQRIPRNTPLVYREREAYTRLIPTRVYCRGREPPRTEIAHIAQFCDTPSFGSTGGAWPLRFCSNAFLQEPHGIAPVPSDPMN